MKHLKDIILIAILLLSSIQSFAQDINVPIQEFILEVPTVNQLSLRPVGAPKMDYLLPDTVDLHLTQYIYYQLKRADGRTVEEGNKTIPIEMWNLALKYVTKTITDAEIATINAYLVAGTFTNVVAIKPK